MQKPSKLNHNITPEMIENATAVIKRQLDLLLSSRRTIEGITFEVYQKIPNLYKLVSEALEAAEAVRPSGWKPIDTAPKDRPIQLYCKDTNEYFVGQNMICLEDRDEMWVIARARDPNGIPITIGCSPDYWCECPETPKENIDATKDKNRKNIHS